MKYSSEMIEAVLLVKIEEIERDLLRDLLRVDWRDRVAERIYHLTEPQWRERGFTDAHITILENHLRDCGVSERSIVLIRNIANYTPQKGR